MPSTYLTKTDREILLDWYEDCMDDMGEEYDTISDQLRYLNKLPNNLFYQECIDYMPDCMDDLKRYLKDHSNRGMEI